MCTIEPTFSKSKRRFLLSYASMIFSIKKTIEAFKDVNSVRM